MGRRRAEEMDIRADNEEVIIWNVYYYKSVEYALEHVLPVVIPLRTPVVQAHIYQVLAVQVQLCIVVDIRGVESQLELSDGFLALLEAGHGGAIRRVHHFNQHQDLVLVLPDGLESPEL